MMWHTFGQPLGIMAVTVSLAGGGVLQRFPDLRVGLLEGNCGWAPWLLQRLDEHWEWLGATERRPTSTERHRSTSASNCYLSVEADETTVKYFIDWFGDDNLVFSTDYPHGDSKYPDVGGQLPEAARSAKSRSGRSCGTTGRAPYGLTTLPSGAARS